jgi:hypothetical protein
VEREKTLENQLVERSSLFWVFLVPFAQKFFFFNKSVVSFSLVVCVFFALLFDVFVRRCKWREKSASNAEKQTQRTRAFKQREQHIIKG